MDRRHEDTTYADRTLIGGLPLVNGLQAKSHLLELSHKHSPEEDEEREASN